MLFLEKEPSGNRPWMSQHGSLLSVRGILARLTIGVIIGPSLHWLPLVVADFPTAA
jgi:hypothetical protein